MSALREAVLVRLRGFAVKTVEAYIHAMEQLWQFYQRSLERLSCEEVQRFLDEIIKVRKLAWATVNVYFSAYRFLYEQVLKWPACKFSIPPKRTTPRHAAPKITPKSSKPFLPRSSPAVSINWLFSYPIAFPIPEMLS